MEGLSYDPNQYKKQPITRPAVPVKTNNEDAVNIEEYVPECDRPVFNSALLEENPVQFLMNFFSVSEDVARKSFKRAQRRYSQDVWLIAQLAKDPVEWYEKTFEADHNTAYQRIREYRRKYGEDKPIDKKPEATATEEHETAENTGRNETGFEFKPTVGKSESANAAEDTTMNFLQAELDKIKFERERLLSRLEELDEQEKAFLLVKGVASAKKQVN